MTRLSPRLLLAALAMLPVASIHAAERPSYDCATAATPRERVVCGDDRLARADRAMAAAWRDARKRLAPGDAAALLADQKQFLEALDDGFAAEIWFKAGIPEDPAQVTADIRRVLHDQGETIDGLARQIELRAALLRALLPDRAGFTGAWMAHDVIVEIGPAADGRRSIRYDAPSYGWPKYQCHFHAEARAAGAGLIAEKPVNTDFGDEDDVRDSRFEFTRIGLRLQITEKFGTDQGMAEDAIRACGHRPGIDDKLFPVAAEALPKRKSP